MLMVAIFVGSRVLFWLSGVRFSVENLSTQTQFLSVDLLRERLVESLFYLHYQPPLFNLFLGIGLKLFRDPSRFYFFTFFGMSLGLVILIPKILEGFGFSKRLAFWAGVIFCFNPSLILYENYLFYTLWEACFLVLLLWGFQKRSLVLIVLAQVLLIFTRASFHPIWALAIALVWIVRERRQWAVATLPCFLGFLWMIKNSLLVGTFSMSSTLGLVAIKNPMVVLAQQGRDDQSIRSLLSSVGQLPPFLPVDRYEPFLSQKEVPSIQAVSQKFKPNGSVNGNHFYYAEISQRYWQDTKRVMFAYPQMVFTWIWEGLLSHFSRPSFDYPVPGLTLAPLHWLLDLYRFFLPDTVWRGLFLAFYFGFLACGGVLAIKKKSLPLQVAFVTCCYLIALSSLVEFGENHRVRFALTPYLYVFMCLTLNELYKGIVKTQADARLG